MTRTFAACLLALFVATGLAFAAAKTLDIYFIDVEGGQSTLIVTPTGESLLIDAGYARGGRDPDRIMAVVHEARLDHIDYLLITHFHPDHVGGVPEIASRIPISTFIDYGAPMGTDRMAAGGFRASAPVRDRAIRHLQPQPGDRLPLVGLEADVVSAGGALVPKPLPGAGQLNSACAGLEDQEDDGTENFRSIGVRFKLGAFIFVDLGDLSGNTLGRLVCPANLVGPASVYLISHHGNYDTDVPAVLQALRPQVAIMNNGATKGGAPTAFANLHRQPGLELWQLHASRNKGAENAPDAFVANVDDGSSAYWLKISATGDGRFTILNSRTGQSRPYPNRHQQPSQ